MGVALASLLWRAKDAGASSQGASIIIHEPVGLLPSTCEKGFVGVTKALSIGS